MRRKELKWLSCVALICTLSACAGARAIAPVDTSQTVGEPTREVRQDELVGRASWYGDRYHGRSTASGEIYDMHALTAAHKTLPFGTVVRVTRTDNRMSVVVKINDRGPFSEGRVIDLSRAAAEEIDMIERGVVDVTLEVLSWGNGARAR